ncbi:MAG: aminoacyl-tRNA hydrolase [Gemmatimonadaceae bacterium]
MKVIVGLGNPGREYAQTRHNVGWWLVDHLAERWHFDGWRKDNDALISAGLIGNIKVRLMKPQTFMNLSGDALRPYTRRPFWAPATDLLVVSDDVALPVGRYRMRTKGSAGGHNGLKSIEHTVKTQEYARLRIGVGPPADRQIAGDLADFVLAPCGKLERAEILSVMPSLTDACELWLRGDVEAAMRLNN